MKTRLWGIGIILIGCAAAIGCVTYQIQPGAGVPAPVHTAVAPAGGSDEPFYDDLAPYGRWVYVTGPGWVWSPNDAPAGWRPYQLGHWVFTDYGWTWASDEPWGWAVYHYGRWSLDPSHGWVWVPGTEWGPAWVAWHEGGGFVGWAPLPWQVTFRADVGLDWGGVSVSIEPSWWSFVGAASLVDPGLRNHIVPATRNVALIQVTRNVTNYTYVDNRVINRGVQVESIGRAVGRKIPLYRVAQEDSPGEERGGKVRGQEFVVFRPDPSRGRKSEGRFVPPGHDPEHHERDFRQPAPNEPNPPVTQPPTTTAGQPQPAPTVQTPAAEPPRRDSKRDHGHNKFLDQLLGRQEAPRQAPHGAPPAQPATPGSPATPATPTQPSAPGQQPLPAAPPSAHPDNQPSSGQQGATTPPARQAPERPQPQPAERGRGKGPKGNASKAGKGKPEAPKPDGADADKSKTEKPESN
ncbi:MAG TPA: DUF6600 domain-containing protein [Candidatus Polarisedimenticolia bacterium]|nr:DUF6600 domain-containing protein [Candidatus Polarisedimenticolia bacterium]